MLNVNKRFIKKEECNLDFYSTALIIVDTQTGVNYLALYSSGGLLSGLTPLLDSNGNVVIDFESEERKNEHE